MTTDHPVDRVREILAEADRQRRLERGAEDLRNAIRLRRTIKVRAGLLRVVRRDEEHTLSSEETSALYEALYEVGSRAAARVRELEAQVSAKESR